jgi:dipeptidyl aminopeptidase/acylaminoacyl peptidase
MHSAAQATAVRVTPERLLALRRPVEVEISADGRVAYTVSPVFRERDGVIETRLWLGDDPVTDEGAVEALPRFSPDGSELAFASDRGHRGRMSLWIHGRGELAVIDGSIEDIRWSPAGDELLVLAADLGSDRAGAQTATRIVEADAPEEDPIVVRPAQHWRRLYRVDARTGDFQEVSPPGVNVFEFDWAGREAVAVCTEEPSESAWYDAWIGVLDLSLRSADRVHDPEWQLQCPRISPAGRIAWIEGFASDRAVVTGTVNVHGVGALAPELDVTWIEWADDETLWYAGSRRSASHFGRLQLDGTYDEVYAGDTLVGHRHQQRISLGGGRVCAVFETSEQPPEVVDFTEGTPEPLTALNDELRDIASAAEVSDYTWTSFDGLEIQGLLFRPRDVANGPFPLVVYVHGGPTSTWSRQFPMLHWLLLVQAGYAVLLPNPRGSSGRGPDFALANLGDMGGGDLKDILAGVDALARDGVAADDKVAIMGGSYGGFMSSWAVTQTNRFAAAVPFAVVTNWLSFHNTTNIGQFDKLFLQADPYDPKGEYTARSPVYHAHKCTTPTLIIHGEVDLCTPLPQATEFYNALVEAGCRTELVIYPREGHGWTEREHQLDAWRRIESWLSEHLG